jgi:shikimate kinase
MQANSGNIILIGMPGSGKSTCGVVAAKLLLKNFFDTDLLIQNREGRRLQQIIDEKGLDYFARAEEEAVLSLDIAGTVIATGGSVVYSPAAMEHLRRMGKVIYLHVPPYSEFGQSGCGTASGLHLAGYVQGAAAPVPPVCRCSD